MKILLRRASSLARACNQRAKTLLANLEAESTIRFSADLEQDVGERLRAQSHRAVVRLNDVIELYRAEARLRAIAGTANAVQVSGLLAEREHFLKPVERTLEGLIAKRRYELEYDRPDVSHDPDEIAAKLRGIRQRMQTVTSGTVDPMIAVTALSDADIASLEDQLALDAAAASR